MLLASPSSFGLLAFSFLLLPGVCAMVAVGSAHASDDDPKRPGAVTTENVPVIPDDVYEDLRQYQNIRGAGFRGWAPDGSGILIRTRFGNTLQLHRVYEPGGRREQITFFEEPVWGGFIPKDDSGDMLLGMSTGGDENTQIYYFNREAAKATMLTDGKSKHGMGAITRDGSKFVVSSNKRNLRDTDLYLANPREAGSLEMLLQTDGEYWFATDWSPDQSKLLIMRWVSINETYPAILDAQTKEITPLPPHPGTEDGQKVSYNGSTLQFSHDGKHIYLASDASGEHAQLAKIAVDDLSKGSEAWEWLTADIAWGVEEFVVDTERDQAAFTVNEDGMSSLYLLRRGKREKVNLPIGIVSSLEFSPDGKQLGMTLSRPTAPSDAYSLDLKSGDITRWTYSEIGGLPEDGFVTPEAVRYESFDDLEVPAFVYRPEGASKETPAPVLINIHGGPESQFRPYFYGIFQYYVREMGVAVIAPNVRGSSGYGKTYLTLDNQRKREDSVKDIGALLDWIETQPDLDSSRVLVSGGSYGGYMVLASLVHYSPRLKGGIDVVGISDFVTFLENTKEYRVDLRRVEYGDERDPEMREFLKDISPLNNADKITSDLFVLHGANDPRVPLGEAKQIAEKVRANGEDVWTLYAANEGHGFSKKENADYANAAKVLFLRKVFGK